MAEKIQLLNCWPPPSPPDVTTSLLDSAKGTKQPPQSNVKRRSVIQHASGYEGHSGKKSRVHKEEVLGKVSLAKWWRSCGNKICHTLNVPDSRNPNTLLYNISREPQAQDFLKNEIRRLSKQLMETDGRPDVHAALGSFYQLLGDWYPAYEHLQKAVSGDFQDKEVLLLFEQLKKQITVLQRQQSIQNEIQSTLSIVGSSCQVEVKAAASFSYQDFLFNFAMTGTPVIISDLAKEITSVPWDLQHIKQVAGSCQVTVKRPVARSVEWARLEDDSTTTVADFIDSLPSQMTLSQMHKELKYLFDWSIPLHCPKLAEELIIPKYFAEDFLQRTNQGSLYQDSWPSLFIAPKGICSELHIDAFGSNFWMALFEGRKKWIFYSKEETALLYPTYCHSLDPLFECDVTKPDFQNKPLLQHAQPKECILEPGQVLFVPAGCPHRVENLENSLAISANYVDLSNLKLVMDELRINQLVDDRAAELYRQLDDPNFCTKMNGENTHMPMKHFKQLPKDYTHYNY